MQQLLFSASIFLLIIWIICVSMDIYMYVHKYTLTKPHKIISVLIAQMCVLSLKVIYSFILKFKKLRDLIPNYLIFFMIKDLFLLS